MSAPRFLRSFCEIFIKPFLYEREWLHQNPGAVQIIPPTTSFKIRKMENWIQLQKYSAIWFEIHPFRSYIIVNRVSAIFCIDTVLFENRYISADVPKTDQVKSTFAMKSNEIWPVGLCLHILPGAFNCFTWQVLGRTFGTALGSVRSFFECFLACWISPRKIGKSAGNPIESNGMSIANDRA